MHVRRCMSGAPSDDVADIVYRVPSIPMNRSAGSMCHSVLSPVGRSLADCDHARRWTFLH